MRTERAGARVAKNIDKLSVEAFVGFQFKPLRVSQAVQGSQIKPARTSQGVQVNQIEPATANKESRNLAQRARPSISFINASLTWP